MNGIVIPLRQCRAVERGAPVHGLAVPNSGREPLPFVSMKRLRSRFLVLVPNAMRN